MANLKVLVLRFSSIGDIVLTTPVVRNLKKQLEGVEIHYATKPQFAFILNENPYIDKVHTLDGKVTELAKTLKKEHFDVVIDLHKNLKTKVIKTLLGVKSYAFNKLNVEKYIYVNFKINKMPNVHIVDRYMETVAELGVTNDDEGLDYFIPEKDYVEPDWLPETHRNGFIAFVIGGQHATKRLPVKRMIELCDKINKPIVLLGGKEDKEDAQTIEDFFHPLENKKEEDIIRNSLKKKAVIFNGVGKFNLNQSASLIEQSKAVFTHDTGLMHIAAAFKKEVFSIWGNTTPFFGMYPYKTKFTVFENNKVDCRPCSKIGYSKCPKGHFDCMNKVVFDFYIPDWE